MNRKDLKLKKTKISNYLTRRKTKEREKTRTHLAEEEDKFALAMTLQE